MTKNNRAKLDMFDSDKMLLSEKSTFSVQEAYRTLRTNVSFSLPGSGCKCIGVVSANRSEGKSSVSLNLALSFAMINKRVLVIDCDLRIPTIASKLNIKSSPGLSNFLVGESEGVRIQRINSRNIDVVTSGDIPPDPTTLLESEQIVKMINALKDHYDYIFFDFPPLIAVSDAVILSQYMDGYLLVVRHGSSEISKIDEVLRQLRFAGAKLIGFVYNGKYVGRKYYKHKNYKYTDSNNNSYYEE